MTGAWEADYRERIRGATRRSAVDALHEELRDMAANVHALQGGIPSPALRALVASALVEPIEHHVVTMAVGTGGHDRVT
ncbi:hypothetical protein [Streptomyces sp. NPDC086835]|uniref:hypothetical protein n=1 Tax=Streptomyces sp. NPDC086835 TaxID=3365761 RepID=UPI00380214BE